MTRARSRATRGRTRPGRLARLDAWLVDQERWLLGRTDGPWAHAVAVDVGLGSDPVTSVQAAVAWRTCHPGLPVIAVDVDVHRVAHAATVAGDVLDVRRGGFDLPLQPDEPARLVRAMNLLRPYRARAVPDAHRRLATALLPGGLLIDGTSDTDGHLLAAHLLRRTDAGLHREGLLLSTDLTRGFAPIAFRDVLPRDLRRRVVPGEAIHQLIADWTAAWTTVRDAGARTPVEAWRASTAALAAVRGDVDLSRAEVGDLVWRPPGGVPAPAVWP